MADVRSLLRNERASRRIQHAHASYSTGTLVCIICQHQVKSESLWDGHLKSSQHLMKLQRIRDGTDKDPTTPAVPNGKKRKAGDDDVIQRKRSRGDGLPDGFFDEGVEDSALPATPVRQHHEIQIPSRPATPALKTPTTTEVPAVQKPAVDEDEWAAFEADITAAEVPTAADAVISAPAMTAAEIAARAADETSAQRKEREEAEREGDKEDAARKLEDEFEEMEGLEARVRRLREKREALRLKEGGQPVDVVKPETAKSNGVVNAEDEEEEDDEDEDEDDDWDNFRLRG